MSYLHKAVREAKHAHLVDRPRCRLRGRRGRASPRPSWPTRRSSTTSSAFVAPLVWPGQVNALAQTVLKLLSPGVPDTYQGTELWDDSLVDPDNRRPVDFELRRRLLAEVDQRTPEQLLERAGGGLPKLAVTRRALEVRRRLPHCFQPGPAVGYRPLAARGSAADHVVGFVRGDDVVALAPRLVLGLAARGGWGDTTVELPPGAWTDELTGDSWPSAGGAAAAVPVGDVLGRFPVAILTAAPADAGGGRGPVTGPAVWAPRPGRVELEVEGGERRPMEPRRPRLVASPRRAPGRLPLRRRRRPVARPPFALAAGRDRRAQPHGRPRRRSVGPTPAGTAGRWPPRSSTSCTSARSASRARSRASSTDLDHLVALGVNAVELMPVAEFPGRRGWGYDGVLLYAPHHAYGGPDGFKGLVDACHGRGLAVVLDVVYNHLGPSGNHLGRFGPYFTDRYRTPWGDAVNLDDAGSDEVRRFLVDNALGWLERLPRRRAAHRRGARLRRPLRRALPRGAGRGGRRRLGPPGPAAVDDRRERPERPAAGAPARGGRLRPGRQLERRPAPRPARRVHRRAAGLLPELPGARRRRPGAAAGVRARRPLRPGPRPPARAARRRPVPPPLPRLRAEPRPGRQPGSG